MAKFGNVSRKDARKHRQAQPLTRQGSEGFWDRPELMGLASDLLFIFAAAALTYAAMLATLRLPFFPLRQVVVDNLPSQVSRAQIEYAARTSVSGNFFTVDLESVRAAVEKQAWVRSASVRRQWPDGIVLSFEEHVAAARWQQAGNRQEMRLVNDHGEVFAAPALAAHDSLPLFAGPEGSAALLLARYHEFAALLAPLARTPRIVVLSPRQAWALRLDDGLVLELGRDQAKHPLQERMLRFAGTYAQAKARARASISVIDMRYPNGFALRLGQADKGAKMAAPSAALSARRVAVEAV